MHYFISDTHFGHSKVLNYRPFNTNNLEEDILKMNDTIIENINSLVNKNDILWHLGDFAEVKKNYYEYCKTYINKIKCKNIYLIIGNHDRPTIAKLFKKTYHMHQISIKNKKVFLCHYPMLAWNKSHHGSWHLFGHVHGDFQNTLPNHLLSLDVGVDANNFKPISELEVIEKLTSKQKYFDLHGYKKIRSKK